MKKSSPTRRSAWTTHPLNQTCAAEMTLQHLRNCVRLLRRQPDTTVVVTGGMFGDHHDFDVEEAPWEKDGYGRDEWIVCFQREIVRRTKK